MSKGQTIVDLEIGQTATIESVGGEKSLRQHFLDMGLLPGSEITLEKYAPMGDPMELKVHGYELTLRKDDAAKIVISKPYKKRKEENIKELKEIPHPGLGEGGKYHVKADEKPLEKGTVISFALAGQQNTGKTTLFNQLTGSNQHVGNFPGVTVDKKQGKIRKHEDTVVTDLPGVYSLSPYSSEELVTRDFLLKGPNGLINILDATNIERNLYLTMQLIELEIPTVVALNMMDELKGNGGTIDINRMEEMLGVPVVPISASKNQGVDELISHAMHIAKYQERPGRLDFCSENEDGGAVHRCIHSIMHLIEDHAKEAKLPIRFASTKVIENDERVIKALKLTKNEKEMIEHIIVQMEQERGLDRNAAIADMRYDFIKKLTSECVVKPRESKERKRSKKIDKVLTGKYTAIPSFILIMALVFFLTFNVIGKLLQNLLALGIDKLTGVVDTALTSWNVNSALHSLIINGLFNGVGSVLSFAPIIVTLFFFLSILEDTGYMARVAFVMDKILRKIGLSGKSIVPMLIGFGCSVPAIMSIRTLPSERDRKMTTILIPFMSCSAKLPIYTFLTAAFFPKFAWAITTGLYFIGIFIAIIVACVSKSTLFKGSAVPFIMELPNYRLPTVKSVLQLLWDKTKDFLKKAFTIILLSTIVIWFMQSFNFRFSLVSDASNSILAKMSGFIAPIFKPLGLGDWRIVTSLFAGFIAKESVVSTLQVLFGSVAALTTLISPLAALSLLVFCLIYTPCVAAIAAVKRELGHKWAISMVIFQCLLAYICALLVTLIGGLL